jgi:hypothetical protein
MLQRARWIHNPVADLGLALCWVPFAVAAHYAQADRSTIALVLSATFLLSFAHQPLTLPIVYGDPEERAARRRTYTWMPVVFVAAAVVGLAVSVPLVAVVAGLWNAEHTLMQRFGITRIYGRKAGENTPADGRVDRLMLVSWLVLAASVAAASAGTERRILGLPLGEVNRQGLEILTSLRDVAVWLVPVAVLAAVLCTLQWVAREASNYRAGAANPAKWVYAGATAVLIGVMLIDPVAGFVGYVGAHAVEYFVIVHRSLASRWTGDGSGGAIGALVRRPGGRNRFLAGYVVAIVAFTGGLLWLGNHRLYMVAIISLGGLHILYDGFIWKLRKPAVAGALVGTPAAVPV